jgi:lipopolysaccharide/colanic/teichoic acid biosynthesis glycosyltransferase
MYCERCDASGARQASRNDPRVTRVGRFLRKASLDELPQLFDVVAGDMSIVGPRPHPVAMRVADRPYSEAVSAYFARHRVKPGLTGLAQVNGWRGETDTLFKAQKRLECDLHYIENWSLLLDIKIMARTFVVVARGANAY